MAEQDSGQEKTEQASSKRLDDARRKGQVATSREMNTFAVVAAGCIGLALFGRYMFNEISKMIAVGLRFEHMDLDRPEAVIGAFFTQVEMALMVVAPIFVVTVLAALAAPAAVGGIQFAPEALGFKLEKIDPIKGIGRMFSAKSMMELVKSLVKVFCLVGLSGWLLYASRGQVISLGLMEVRAAVPVAVSVLFQLLLLLGLGLAAIAAIDLPFQLWNHAKQLKMTKQEVRDENKETEGSPELRQRVRQVQREMAQRRMMEQVPSADVVVTNPDHYAVALRYEQSRQNAPKLVAKGADHVALRIREIARQNRVPIIEAPPLARALHFSTELDEIIPQGLYVAVARVLVHVYQLKRARRYGDRRPEPLGALPVPDELLPAGDPAARSKRGTTRDPDPGTSGRSTS